MSNYKDLSPEQLRQLLVQRDKDLADSRKKNAENERVPQVIWEIEMARYFRLIFQMINTSLQPLLSENACLALNLIRYDKTVENHQSREAKTFRCRALKTDESKKTAPPKEYKTEDAAKSRNLLLFPINTASIYYTDFSIVQPTNDGFLKNQNLIRHSFW